MSIQVMANSLLEGINIKKDVLPLAASSHAETEVVKREIERLKHTRKVPDQSSESSRMQHDQYRMGSDALL